MKTTSLILSLVALSQLAPAAEKPVAQPTTLSNAQLQQHLGIRAWEITIPEKYTDRVGVFYSITDKDGNKSSHGTSTIPLAKDRTALITLTQNTTSYTYRTQSDGDTSTGEIPIPQFSEADKKVFIEGNLVRGPKPSEIVDDHILLHTHELLATPQDQPAGKEIITTTYATLEIYVRLLKR